MCDKKLKQKNYQKNDLQIRKLSSNWSKGSKIILHVLLYEDPKKKKSTKSHLSSDSTRGNSFMEQGNLRQKKGHGNSIIDLEGLKIQEIYGICIKRSNCGINSSFKIQHVVGSNKVVQTFPLYSPFILGIDVVSS